jgi:hypothetical protein
VEVDQRRSRLLLTLRGTGDLAFLGRTPSASRPDCLLALGKLRERGCRSTG